MHYVLLADTKIVGNKCTISSIRTRANEAPDHPTLFQGWRSIYQHLKTSKGIPKTGVKRRKPIRTSCFAHLPTIKEDPAAKKQLFLEVCQLMAAWRKADLIERTGESVFFMNGTEKADLIERTGESFLDSASETRADPAERMGTRSFERNKEREADLTERTGESVLSMNCTEEADLIERTGVSFLGSASETRADPAERMGIRSFERNSERKADLTERTGAGSSEAETKLIASQEGLDQAARARQASKNKKAEPATYSWNSPYSFAADLNSILDPRATKAKSAFKRVMQHVSPATTSGSTAAPGCKTCKDTTSPKAAKDGGRPTSICQERAISAFLTIVRGHRMSDHSKILATKALLRMGNDFPNKWAQIASGAAACLLSPVVTNLGLSQRRRKNEDLREHSKRLLATAYKKGNLSEISLEAKLQLEAALRVQKADPDIKADQAGITIIAEFAITYLRESREGDEAATNNWKQTLAQLQLPPMPELKVGETEATWEQSSGLKNERSDPETIFFQNVNGFRARWARGEIEESLARSDYPDVVGFVETKATWNQIQKLPGFLDMLKARGYLAAYCHWSKSTLKGSHGYAGVMILSKVRAKTVRFGCRSAKFADEARVVTVSFKSFNVACAYMPTAGIKEGALTEKLEFENLFRKHCSRLKEETSKPVIIVGDLNVNPTDEDYNVLAFKNIIKKLKSNQGQRPLPGCSSEERESLFKLLQTTDTVSLQRHLHPQDQNAMTWFPDELGRRNKWGQTLDHILAPRCMLDGTFDFQVEKMRTLQQLAGSSDHCPLWVKLRPSPNRVSSDKLTYLESYSSPCTDEQVFVATSTGVKHQIALQTRPIVRMQVGAELQEVMLDTGAFTTVGNPAPGHTPRTDPGFHSAFEGKPTALPSKPVVKIHGIGGGVLECYEEGLLPYSTTEGGPARQVQMTFLPQHVPHMPRILLGLPAIVGPLGGLSIRIPCKGPNKDSMLVVLGAFPDTPLQCLKKKQSIESLFGAKVVDERKPPKTFRADFLEDVEDDQETFECLAEALLEVQKSSCSDPGCRICGLDHSKPRTTKRRPPKKGKDARPMSEAFKNDPKSGYGEEEESEDGPYSMPEIPLHFSAEKQKEAVPTVFKGLLDSGATISLISESMAAKFPSAKTGQASIKIRAADGGVTSATKTITLHALLPQEHRSERTFIIFPGLPYDFLFGHDTLAAWNTKINYTNNTVEFGIEGNTFSLSWNAAERPSWRAPVKLRTTRMHTIPPRSIKVIEVKPPPQEDLEARQHKSGFSESRKGGRAEIDVMEVPHREMPDRVLIRNSSTKPILLAKNAYIADFCNVSISFEEHTEQHDQNEQPHDEPSAPSTRPSLNGNTGDQCLHSAERRPMPADTAIGCIPPMPASSQKGCIPPMPGSPEIGCIPPMPGRSAIGCNPPMPASPVKGCYRPRESLQSMVGMRPTGAGKATTPVGSGHIRSPHPAAGEGACRDPIFQPIPEPNCPEDSDSTCDNIFSFVAFQNQSAEDGQQASQWIEERTPLQVGAQMSGVCTTHGSSDTHAGLMRIVATEVDHSIIGNECPMRETGGVASPMRTTTGEPSLVPGSNERKLGAAPERTATNVFTTHSEERAGPRKSESMSDADIEAAFKVGHLAEVKLAATSASCTKAELMVLMRLLVDNDDILTDGSLAYDSDTKMKHSTTAVISTTTQDPMFKAYAKDWTPQDRAEIDKQVEEKMRQGIVEPSSAPWSSNVVLIRKDGRVRMAIDYRKLNSVTVKDVYPMPKVQALIDCLEGSHWLTGLDCAQAYHQIPMGDERSKDLTSFRVPGRGLLRFAYLPFGLANAGAVWSRFIDDAMQDLRYRTVLCYADDILCYTKDPKVEAHARDLQGMFNRLRKYGIKIKASKLHLGVRELPFLGVLAGVNGVRPNPEKVSAILEAKLPNTVGQLRRVIGQFAYYRRFIPWFAEIANPLYKMVGHNKQNKRDSKNQIVFNKEQREAFEALKHKITTSPIVLAYPDWDAPFEVHCDASKQGLGAVLCQVVDEQERVIMYASRALTDTERKYHSYEQEALAMVWSIELFRHYLYGRKFTVRSDCRSLKWLKSRTDTARVMRWVMRLQEFDFTVVYRPGRLAGNVDPLTRGNTSKVSPYGEEPIEELYDTTKSETESSREFSIESTEAPERGDFSFLYAKEERVNAVTTRKRKIDQGIDTKHEPSSSDPSEQAPALQAESDAPQQDQSEDPSNEGDELEGPQTPAFFDCEEDLEGWDIQDFRREQNCPKSKTMASLAERMKADHAAGKKPSFERGEDGLIYKCADPGLQGNSKVWIRPARKRRVVVPESLRAFVIALHHNIELSAHQGHKRVLKAITPKYYWPGMTRDAKRWVAACSGCKRRKTPRPMRAGLNEPVLATSPNQLQAIDLLGPLIETEAGNVWILTIFDQFTRWPIAIPLPNTRQETIMNALYAHLLCEKSAPKKIISDRGRNLISESVKRMCKRWGIAHITTGGYNPTGNSCVERFHKFIGAAVTILMDKKTSDWDCYLPAVLFAYRVSENDATGYSPFFLTTGGEPNLPADTIFSHDNEEYEGEHDFVEKTAGRLKKAFEYVRRKQYEAADTNYQRTAANRYKPDFNKGDFLFLWERAAKETRLERDKRQQGLEARPRKLPQKFTNPWTGPYEMVNWCGDNYCLIDKDGNNVRHNVNRLSKFNPWETRAMDTFEWSRRRRTRLEKDGLIDDGPPEEEVVNEDGPHQSTKTPVQKGELIIFPTAMADDWPLPFGVGLVTDVDEEGTFEFQWMGNKPGNPFGTFRPCWLDPKDNRPYYAVRATKSNHTKYLGDLEVPVLASDITVKGFHILDANNKITKGAFKAIRADKEISSRATVEFSQRLAKA